MAGHGVGRPSDGRVTLLLSPRLSGVKLRPPPLTY
jgi:hypothetical protein